MNTISVIIKLTSHSVGPREQDRVQGPHTPNHKVICQMAVIKYTSLWTN